MGVTLLVRGNTKLGPDVWHVDLPAGPPERGGSCPVTSDVCRSLCYAQKGMYLFQLDLYAQRLALWRDDPVAFEEKLAAEVGRLPAGAYFRWHTSGDIVDAAYARMVARIAKARPDIHHWAYTRTWDSPDPELREAVESLRHLPNLRLWFSTDATMRSPAEAGWESVLEARIFDNELDARFAGYAVCPEQVGRQPDCQTCGLCPGIKSGRGFRLAFLLH